MLEKDAYKYIHISIYSLPVHLSDHVHPFMATMHPSSDGHFQ